MTSPGGVTAQALAALDRAGVRAAFTTRSTRCWRRACDDAAGGRRAADIANYVDAVFLVYSLIIIAYIIVSLVLSLGGRPPFSRAFDAVLTFLRDVSEPLPAHLPPLHPVVRPARLLSPILALLVLGSCGGIIVNG